MDIDYSPFHHLNFIKILPLEARPQARPQLEMWHYPTIGNNYNIKRKFSAICLKGRQLNKIQRGSRAFVV
jgi:hypothetical protein